MHSTGLLPPPSLEEGAGKRRSEDEPTQWRYSAVVMDLHTLRASLSGTFLQGRNDVVNQCLEFGIYIIYRSMAVISLANAMAAVWFSVAHRINTYIFLYIYIYIHHYMSAHQDFTTGRPGCHGGRPQRLTWLFAWTAHCYSISLQHASVHFSSM